LRWWSQKQVGTRDSWLGIFYLYRGLKIIDGFVVSEQANPGTSFIELYLLLSSSIGPASSARTGHESTHAGFLLSASLSVQNVHICIFGFSSSPNCGTSYGQACLHAPQALYPRHSSRLTAITPFCVFLLMALTGHASAQAGFAQWWQEREVYVKQTLGYDPHSSDVTLRHRAGPAAILFQSLHATAHA
jgi:hypothetical protein